MRSLKPKARWMALAALAVAAAPSARAYAQVYDPDMSTRARVPAHVSVTPFLGMYNPIGKLRADSTVEFLQLMTLVVGARVAVPVTRRLALEGTGAWTPAPSWVAQSDWEQTVDVSGRVMMTSIRGRFDFNTHPENEDLAFSLSSGIGAVHRHGPAWEGLTGTTDVAGVLGASTRMQSFGSRLSYGVDLDGFFTRASFTDYTGKRTIPRFHADVVSSFAITVTF